MDKDLFLAAYGAGAVTGIFILEPIVNILVILIKKLISKLIKKVGDE